MTTKRHFLLLGMLIVALGQARIDADIGARKNVLFIAADDLRPELGVYGTRAITPHIDALAAMGVTFNRAYCQYPVCNPSRASLMSGLRPDTIGIWNLSEGIRTHVRDVVTLPQHFKNNGYFAQGFGKIFHNGFNDSKSWSVPFREAAFDYFTGKSWSMVTRNLDRLPDAVTSDRAIEALGSLKDRTEPFFLAVGFIRPHLPFKAPASFFDMYPIESINLPDNYFRTQNLPDIAIMQVDELGSYSDILSRSSISDQQAKELIRAYLACVSYVDEQVGRILEALDELGLRENTIIVFWGDHGFHLGENRLWSKAMNFNICGRSPLIVSAPGHSQAAVKSDALVEFVDIYPTLCELAELPTPEVLEGLSFAPLLENPSRPWKTAAFYQHTATSLASRYPMGYTIKTDQFRYTEWTQVSRNVKEVVARELYDHSIDLGENVNVAEDPNNAEVIARLSARLAAGWREALPPEDTSNRIQFRRNGSKAIELLWTEGVLQSAKKINGPWSSRTEAVSPYSIKISASEEFFRTTILTDQ